MQHAYMYMYIHFCMYSMYYILWHQPGTRSTSPMFLIFVPPMSLSTGGPGAVSASVHNSHVMQLIHIHRTSILNCLFKFTEVHVSTTTYTPVTAPTPTLGSLPPLPLSPPVTPSLSLLLLPLLLVFATLQASGV